MPVIKSAKKKLRQDNKREKTNDLLRKKLRDSIKKANKSKSEKDIKNAFRTIDKTAKRKIIHPNKASRIKSSLSKLAQRPTQKSPQAAKKPTKKKAR